MTKISVIPVPGKLIILNTYPHLEQYRGDLEVWKNLELNSGYQYPTMVRENLDQKVLFIPTRGGESGKIGFTRC